jgi:hypothetical protein
MTVNFDLVIDTEEDSVDMKAGLDTMQGISDAMRCAAQTILTGKTPKQQWHKGKVRTTLKRNFKGSYGHIFSLDIYDDKLSKKLNSIGRLAFVELISYIITESLYKETNPDTLSPKARKVLDELGENYDKAVSQLRISSLSNIHEISSKFNHDVKIRHRISRDKQTIIAQFNQDTAKVLEATEQDDAIDLTVNITRLNIFTGNGRLQIKDQDTDETIAFGFGIRYTDIELKAKKVFSENLNHNNGIHQEEYKYLNIIASPVKLNDGKIVKYIVKGFHSVE